MATEQSGFPTLVPALITKVNIGDVNPLGVIHNGSTVTHFGTPTGTIETVTGFEPAFKANVNWGADWLSFDPDGQHARINLKGIARTEQGHSIDFRYKGVIRMADDVKKIFEFKPDMATVPFGYATGAHSFVVADPALKEIENSTFVSNGRIIVHEKGLTVETRQSKVVPAAVMN
ncbi:uncharacterized protein EURHEDRAFT_534610 [Aspergillus ruber CBS 135680]|uniref:Uncharacterized protein n=1 Tax=Aspergillus ruber (strain CBS 135680) TaxID=1388766 RepID=A0A017S003_ASPRC|nr:uncharacterized protein EURHEDRAFT_534610 [Aspergillus ruber CBS 135680]EYE89964.1 hypothetical protein EURHEDRAFT_534610 [Aspergillus ruber CBS 135680]